MERESKISRTELIGFIAIIIILMHFPYLMMVEHVADNKANSYYHDGK